jgi:ferric-dicitrate binding protein FerR (iron transport regulator)
MDYKNKIKDFYEGKLNQEEVREFLMFLESAEAEKELNREIIQLWVSDLKNEQIQWDQQKLWQKIISKRKEDSEKQIKKKPVLRKLDSSTWTKVAAAVLIFGLVAFYFLENRVNQNVQESPLVEQQFITKSNAKGKKTKIVLEDGSEVYLNSESSIRYPNDFKENRNISLEGEAYFRVAKDSIHPFTVDAKGVLTTALGTSFNISTFHSDEMVTVTLLTGKVKLNQEGKDGFIELNPGEESFLSSIIPVLEKYQVSGMDKILWTKGILKFQEASLFEMKEILERWYGVEIFVKGQPKELRASGVFDPQESLENVLKVMGETLEFEFEMEDQMITINF